MASIMKYRAQHVVVMVFSDWLLPAHQQHARQVDPSGRRPWHVRLVQK